MSKSIDEITELKCQFHCCEVVLTGDAEHPVKFNGYDSVDKYFCMMNDLTTRVLEKLEKAIRSVKCQWKESALATALRELMSQYVTAENELPIRTEGLFVKRNGEYLDPSKMKRSERVEAQRYLAVQQDVLQWMYRVLEQILELPKMEYRWMEKQSDLIEVANELYNHVKPMNKYATKEHWFVEFFKLVGQSLPSYFPQTLHKIVYREHPHAFLLSILKHYREEAGSLRYLLPHSPSSHY